MFFKRNTLKNKMEETYKYWIDFVDKFEKSGNKETFCIPEKRQAWQPGPGPVQP